MTKTIDELLANLSDGERRIIEEHVDAYKLQAAIGTAGAVRDKFNNSIMAIQGYVELIFLSIDESHPLYDDLEKIMGVAEKMADVNKKLANIQRYVTTPHDKYREILDIERASKDDSESKTLLIADDEQMILDLLTDVGERAGYDVITATNGQEAVEQADKADVILLDCRMPNKNGLQALAEIREKYKDKPIYFMSGLVADEMRAELDRHNVIECLEKPISTPYLIELLEKHI